jgi:hypothetical protein
MAMSAGLADLYALCTPGVVQGSVIVGLFVAGAAGSVTHCAPMCGGFVLGQVADRMSRISAPQMCESQRLRAGLLLPYHAGRLTTYAALGAVTASSAAVLGRAPWFTALSTMLLVVAALLFLSQAASRIWPGHPTFMGGPGGNAQAAWARLIRKLTFRLDRGRPSNGFVLGLALGLLPCGFLYGALFAAATTSRPELGALAMLAFGAGTVPALMIVGLVGRAAGERWLRVMRLACPPLLALNATLLLTLAVLGLRG